VDGLSDALLVLRVKGGDREKENFEKMSKARYKAFVFIGVGEDDSAFGTRFNLYPDEFARLFVLWLLHEDPSVFEALGKALSQVVKLLEDGRK
jgi:hypothetical protein